MPASVCMFAKRCKGNNETWLLAMPKASHLIIRIVCKSQINVQNCIATCSGYFPSHSEIYTAKAFINIFGFSQLPTCGLVAYLQAKRSWVRFPAVWLLGNNLGQVVHTCASVIKQYNLVPVAGQQCPLAGKAAIGLASHWTCIRLKWFIHLWAQCLHHLSTDRTLTVPWMHNKFVERSFAVVGPHLWNSLPTSMQHCSYRQLRWYLKAHLYGIQGITVQCGMMIFCII